MSKNKENSDKNEVICNALQSIKANKKVSLDEIKIMLRYTSFSDNSLPLLIELLNEIHMLNVDFNIFNEVMFKIKEYIYYKYDLLPKNLKIFIDECFNKNPLSALINGNTVQEYEKKEMCKWLSSKIFKYIYIHQYEKDMSKLCNILDLSFNKATYNNMDDRGLLLTDMYINLNNITTKLCQENIIDLISKYGDWDIFNGLLNLNRSKVKKYIIKKYNFHSIESLKILPKITNDEGIRQCFICYEDKNDFCLFKCNHVCCKDCYYRQVSKICSECRLPIELEDAQIIILMAKK